MGERRNNGKGLIGHHDNSGIHAEGNGKYWGTLSRGVIGSDIFLFYFIFGGV